MKIADKCLKRSGETNIMKACKGLDCDSTDEEIEAVAKKSGHDVASIKKIAKNKKKMGEAIEPEERLDNAINANTNK